MPGIKLIGNVTIAVVLVYGAYLAFHGEVTVGVLAAFLLYLRQFFEPMQEISQFYNTFQSASAALEKLSGVLEEEPDVPEPVRPVPLRGAAGRGAAATTCGFAYVDDRPVLPDLDLDDPGRADDRGRRHHRRRQDHDRQAGRAVLRPDGRPGDARRRRPARPRRADAAPRGGDGDPGELPVRRHGRRQHPVRPTRTRPTTRSSRRREAIGAHEFIAELPDGYDTRVESRGGRLSAGQRQLVAFARAFLADPAVLILDEATSSLDVPSERLVQRALRTILAAEPRSSSPTGCRRWRSPTGCS